MRSGHVISRLLKGISLLPLSIAVAVLIVIGLINFSLLIAIIPKLIAVVVIVGILAMLLRRMLLLR